MGATPQQVDGQKGETKGFRSEPNWRILVADDNEDSAASLAKLLQLLGYDVRTSHDGLEAMRAAETFRPNVALLDIGMPKMNGYEVARLIREQGWGKSLILVALTGWGQEEDKQRALKAGFDHHLTKPVELETVLNLLAPRAEAKKV
jgi:CheY-like chemotaxis protein